MLPDKAGLEKKYVYESGDIIFAVERCARICFSVDVSLQAASNARNVAEGSLIDNLIPMDRGESWVPQVGLSQPGRHCALGSSARCGWQAWRATSAPGCR